jgi:UDP-N-acetylmuramoyl-tripeptide--D-alanyl-D-alanine ligase
VRIVGSLGKSQAWSAAAATAVGSVLGMNLVQIGEALQNYHGPKGRLKILRGIKNSNIIDDTYNASPASTRLALETLRDLLLPSSATSESALAGRQSEVLLSGRKVAVLGDMLELGEYSEKAHRDVGVFASEVVDILVCVGSQAKFIAESAQDKLSSDKIFTFENSDNAKPKVRELIREHDLVLVKGSQGMRMEKIVEAIMAEPEYKKELLVRQSRKWLAR